jgi:predicted Fe-Mo cluster-binding NifX family protein
VAGENVGCVITGHIGRKAAAVLKGAGVRIFLGASGPVKAAIEAFKENRLEENL